MADGVQRSRLGYPEIAQQRWQQMSRHVADEPNDAGATVDVPFQGCEGKPCVDAVSSGAKMKA